MLLISTDKCYSTHDIIIINLRRKHLAVVWNCVEEIPLLTFWVIIICICLFYIIQVALSSLFLGSLYVNYFHICIVVLS